MKIKYILVSNKVTGCSIIQILPNKQYQWKYYYADNSWHLYISFTMFYFYMKNNEFYPRSNDIFPIIQYFKTTNELLNTFPALMLL